MSISLHIGQCGVQVGIKYWQTLLKEHEKSPKSPVFFENPDTATQDYHLLRAIFIDLEPGSIDNLSASSIGDTLRPDNLVAASSGAGHNWAKGYYTEGAELIDEALDAVRAEIERCDCLQGFQLYRSFGGGTGSGMGTLLLEKLQEEYPGNVFHDTFCLPSSYCRDGMSEVYNVLLSWAKVHESCTFGSVIDYTPVSSLAARIFGTRSTYPGWNSITSAVMSDFSSCLRLPTREMYSLPKLATSLVPYPQYPYIVHSLAPGFQPSVFKDQWPTLPEMVGLLGTRDTLTYDCQVNRGQNLAGLYTARGTFDRMQFREAQILFEQDSKFQFLPYIPDAIKSTFIDDAPEDYRSSLGYAVNSSSIREMLITARESFAAIFRRKAFLHWYSGEGMDEMEFIESDEIISSAIFDYQQLDHLPPLWKTYEDPDGEDI
mmetsp:Transcript_28228/g.32349  ORF Transcript_28228/g.32349 Transcript_28228/m.32349 type:complete len:431 (-) Transcript_28228:22-1314(-)